VKPIVVKDQVRLSASRGMYLTLAGMYYRLTRSTITIAIVALAVAFLAYILSYSISSQERSAAASDEYQQSKALGEWVTRTGHIDDLPAIVASTAARDTGRVSEYWRWGSVTDAESAGIRAAVDRLRDFLAYFATMRRASRAVLLGDTDPHQLPKRLENPDYFAVFVKQLTELSLRPPLGSAEALQKFLSTDWPVINSYVDRVRAGQLAAIQRIQSGLKGRTVVEMLTSSPEEMAALAEAAGYQHLGSRLQLLSAQARLSQDEGVTVRALGIAEVRGSVAHELGIEPKAVEFSILAKWLTSKSRAQSFVAFTQSARVADMPPVERLLAVAKNYRRIEQLQRALNSVPAESIKRGFSGMPQATRWLVIVSFIVCAVGICNTMFMSVTERFTEIATMKCLGAMDGFVMMLFVFEAIIQGLAGSVCGLVLGVLLALLRGFIGYGGLFFESLPLNALFASLGFSLVAGVALAGLSAVGPAWMAARLAPMEAMRVE
jgi:hypothetical protein